MIKRLGDKLMRRALAAGGAVCPGCGVRVEVPADARDDGMRQVVRCGHCGRPASLGEILCRGGRGAGEVPGTVEKPPGTKIVRRDLKDGSVGWEVPASGKSGGLLVFGVIWLAISLGIGAVMLASATGAAGWKALFPVAMSTLFIAVGVAMTYFGLRAKYAMNLIVVKPDSVVLVRSLFGRKKVRTVSRKGLKWVKKQVFYEQNYQPVYGVEVKAADGKLRFGSTLEEAEKDWLVSEIRGAAGGVGETVRQWKREERFVMTLPEQTGHADVIGIAIGIALSLAFVLVGVFPLKDAGFFRYLWTGFAGVFFVTCLVGLGQMLRKSGTVIEVVVGRDSVGVRRRKAGRRTEQEDVPRDEVEAVRVYESGSQNNRTGSCLEILTGTTALPVVRWEARDGLVEFGRELAGRLGLGD